LSVVHGPLSVVHDDTSDGRKELDEIQTIGMTGILGQEINCNLLRSITRGDEMILKHVGLACSSEYNADKFYQTLLGLKKSAPKRLPLDLSRAIFGIEAELKVINYISEDLHCEIFISSRIDNKYGQMAHLCLEVGDLSEFLQECRSLGVEISRIPKGDGFLTFVKDFDGNLFEIKEA